MSTVAETPRHRSWLSMLGWFLPVVAALVSFPVMQQLWYIRHDAGGEVPSTGNGLTASLTQALALATLVAALTMLVFGSKGRRVLAVIIAALAGWMLLLAFTAKPAGEVSIVGEEKLGPVDASPTINLYLYMALAVLTLVGALITLWRPGGARGEARREGKVEEDQWVVLDRGGDPTTA